MESSGDQPDKARSRVEVVGWRVFVLNFFVPSRKASNRFLVRPVGSLSARYQQRFWSEWLVWQLFYAQHYDAPRVCFLTNLPCTALSSEPEKYPAFNGADYSRSLYSRQLG